MRENLERIDNHISEDLLLACRNEREEKFIKYRFGVEDGVSKTLQEVADHFGITRDRAMQIEKMIYRRISRHHRRKRILDFLDA